MKVLKRSGEIQPLTIDKISVSVSRASDDAKQPLNAGDIEMLTNGVIKRINNTDKDT
jgi:transcriptional regulator NrdR family protein